ncbi:MAG: type II CRISPR-associated endonuclease Cas1 [Candidatus Dojkabacteria bacterium]|nr:MAG: type II CRISPR-associated endonuclease Cas1 [Candidatus Dojkabacteria bacterium]
MSWRTLVVTGRAKLDYQLGYMVIRKDTEQQIFLDDVNVLILESTAISLTTYLLKELVNKKVKVVFCDDFHNPAAELAPFYNNKMSSANIELQIGWKEDIKKKVWAEIIKQKIINQAFVLAKNELVEKSKLLLEYVKEVQLGDSTNREGHAAKVYMNALFGNSFSRGQDNEINSALNYGYTILLSAFNREIVASGYLTQLGIAHHNTYNYFNLSSDFMEPVRPLIDLFVKDSDFKEFGTEQKHLTVDILNRGVRVRNEKQYLSNAIAIYVKSIINVLNSDKVEDIKFINIMEGEQL